MAKVRKTTKSKKATSVTKSKKVKRPTKVKAEPSSERTFVVAVGKVKMRDASGEFRMYKKGQKIKSSGNLKKIWPNKFVLLGESLPIPKRKVGSTSPIEDEEDDDLEDEVVDETEEEEDEESGEEEEEEEDVKEVTKPRGTNKKRNKTKSKGKKGRFED